MKLLVVVSAKPVMKSTCDVASQTDKRRSSQEGHQKQNTSLN